MKKAVAPLLAILLAASAVFAPVSKAQEPVVRAVLFYSDTCSLCHVVLAEVLPPLQAKYGASLEIKQVEITPTANYELLMRMEEVHQVPPEKGVVPEMFIGDQVLFGADEIRSQLPLLIEEYLAKGGVGWPQGFAEPPLPTVWPPGAAKPTPKYCHICDEGDPVVKMYFFWNIKCPRCRRVIDEVLTPLQERYGRQLVVDMREVERSLSNYEMLGMLEQQFGTIEGALPVIFIGEYVLHGDEAPQQQLAALVEHYLAEGGVDFPELKSPTTPKSPSEVGQSAIHLAYFYQVGCHECDRAELDLRYVESKYPQLRIHEFDIKESATLAEWLGERNGVPLNKRLTAPAVFIGADALVGDEISVRALEGVIQKYAVSGSEAYWEDAENLAGAEENILSRFRSFGVLTVVVAGLVDGLNPCAFATIVFFISYLAFAGRKGRDILLVGGMFALGVFLTYLGVGIGLLKFLAALPFLPAISRYLYAFTALLCLALAAGSVYDWLQMRRGRPEGMKLKLPTRMRRWINRVIREGANVRAIAGIAFVTGIVISLIELACTGQVYLPTIIFVLGVPEMRARAVTYLLLYNILFVLPLVTVFLLAYWGTTSQSLGQFINRRTGTIKLATAGLFVLLAVWMVFLL
jgi:cytochrome c biogenesis protein CcdA